MTVGCQSVRLCPLSQDGALEQPPPCGENLPLEHPRMSSPSSTRNCRRTMVERWRGEIPGEGDGWRWKEQRWGRNGTSRG